MTSPLIDILKALELNQYSKEYDRAIREYAINLESKNLPIIFSTKHLAAILMIPHRVLKTIITSNNYSGYKIRKRSGGHRWILAPNEQLKLIQTWIKNRILDKVALHESATGFIAKKSITVNAAFHAKKSTILSIDLYRFFDTINVKRVYGVFRSLGYHPNLSHDFAMLLCATPPKKYWKEIEAEGIVKVPKGALRKILPQGAPSSPSITNIICYKLDKRLSKLAMSLDCSYSRYADDITFSGERDNLPSMRTVSKIISDEGFFVNKSKVEYSSINKRQFVTGLIVNGGVRVPKEDKKEIETHLHYCIKYGPDNHLQYLEKRGKPIKSNYKHWLLGKIAFVNAVEPNTAKKLFDRFNLVNWGL